MGDEEVGAALIRASLYKGKQRDEAVARAGVGWGECGVKRVS